MPFRITTTSRSARSSKERLSSLGLRPTDRDELRVLDAGSADRACNTRQFTAIRVRASQSAWGVSR